MKAAFRFCLAIVLLAGTLVLAPHGHVVQAGQRTSNGYVGGVYYTSTKANTYLGGLWAPSLQSSTLSAVTLLGFSWWTIREQCFVNGQWQDWTFIQNPRPPGYNSNSTNYYTDYPLGYSGCSTQRRFINQGNHEYSNSGDHIYPYLELVE